MLERSGTYTQNKMNDKTNNERFPVWDALSEFFLDTELGKKDYERIANILAETEYSIKDLQEILYYEVYPVCKWNLLSIAGEWAGFHPDWIMEHIAPIAVPLTMSPTVIRP